MDHTSQIIQDAEDNYQNGRIEDAHSHFTSIAQNFLEKGKINESMYFSYRSILCLEILDEKYKLWKEVGILGLNLLKVSLKELSDSLELQRDPRIIKKLLHLQLNLIESSNFITYTGKIKQMILNSIQQILEEPNLTPKTKIQLLEESIELAGADKKLLKSYKNQIFEILTKEAKKIQEDEISIFNKIQMYEQALKHCLDENSRIEIEGKLRDLKKKIE